MSGSLVHIVLYELNDALTDEKLSEVTGLFYECHGKVPGVTFASVSRNFSESGFASNWTYSVLIELENESALETFLAHPHHDKITAATQDGFASQVAVFDHKRGSEPIPMPCEWYDMPYEGCP